ncbi:uncharacterized protein LOC113383620 [Ctenocephalides felis]|uniref:uncharacterized protein LOC113383620 n=1 Tax=Ctenocephalides felis TaxID=7515 RepID=UPI000E6E508F|nr:uncharacterized protein LOC113383620 [Ctenocephalides felis]
MIAKDGLPLNTVEKTGKIEIKNTRSRSTIFGCRCVTALTESDNADYLEQVIINMTEKCDITSDKVVAFITDNGTNIDKAVTNVYGKNKHMPCFAHTLNLVASKPFDNKDGLDKAKNLLTAVKNITSSFKQNANADDSLKKAHDQQTKPLGLIQSVCFQLTGKTNMLSPCSNQT